MGTGQWLLRGHRWLRSLATYSAYRELSCPGCVAHPRVCARSRDRATVLGWGLRVWSKEEGEEREEGEEGEAARECENGKRVRRESGGGGKDPIRERR